MGTTASPSAVLGADCLGTTPLYPCEVFPSYSSDEKGHTWLVTACSTALAHLEVVQGLDTRRNAVDTLRAVVCSLVQQAIAAWPTLMASGLRLGSPAVSVAQDGTRRDSWLGQFMQQVCCLAPGSPETEASVAGYGRSESQTLSPSCPYLKQLLPCHQGLSMLHQG